MACEACKRRRERIAKLMKLSVKRAKEAFGGPRDKGATAKTAERDEPHEHSLADVGPSDDASDPFDQY